MIFIYYKSFKYKFVPHYHINIVEFFFKTAFYFYKQLFGHNYNFMEVIFFNKLRILASDGGYPKRTATTKVNIHLQRNLDAPVFDRKIYNGTVLEQNRIGRPFTQVTATDSDTQVTSDIYECLILSLIHEEWHFLLNSIKFLLELDIFWFYDLIVN